MKQVFKQLLAVWQNYTGLINNPYCVRYLAKVFLLLEIQRSEKEFNERMEKCELHLRENNLEHMLPFIYSIKEGRALQIEFEKNACVITDREEDAFQEFREALLEIKKILEGHSSSVSC